MQMNGSPYRMYPPYLKNFPRNRSFPPSRLSQNQHKSAFIILWCRLRHCGHEGTYNSRRSYGPGFCETQQHGGMHSIKVLGIIYSTPNRPKGLTELYENGVRRWRRVASNPGFHVEAVLLRCQKCRDAANFETTLYDWWIQR
jgi:hypothetical protein